ncbi:hypothetical protein [Neptuniibacter halophilus]|uniref:hypothetical protein n=1 Tax=Neptuniibacter halophilus TaxID=651666 RepID=UPI002572B528|nr:hypothetical protein [Neptuniibacter halophilus]
MEMVQTVSRNSSQFFLVLFSMMSLLLVSGCQPLTTVPSSSVDIHVETGTIQVEGPFSTANDQLNIIAVSVYDDDAEMIAAGESSMISSAALSWNDVTVFAINGREGTFASEDIPGPEASYDYVSFRGYCLRESNGNMSLIFAGNYSGTVNAARPDDLFYVFYDQKHKRVEYKEVTEGFLTTKGCVDLIDAYKQLSVEAVKAEQQLIESLTPLKGKQGRSDLNDTLQVTELSSDPRASILEHFERYNGYYNVPDCEVGQDDEIYERSCLPSYSQFSLVVKHPEYEIHRLEFIHDCDSAGVDLLHVNETDSWFHLYSIPSGCSKHFLYYPEYTSLSSSKISLELCTYCSHWGTWEAFEFDMNSQVIRRVER